MEKENNDFDLNNENPIFVDDFKKSKYYNEKLEGEELKEAFRTYRTSIGKLKTEQLIHNYSNKQRPILLKDLVEQAKKRDKTKQDQDTKPVYSFRIDKQKMNKIDHYINKRKITKSMFLENLIDKFFKNKIVERKDFNKYIKIDIDNGETHVYLPLNNNLDIWVNGEYRANKQNLNSHEGLVILESAKSDVIYYAHLFFNIDFNKENIFDNIRYEFISRDEALELTIMRNNKKLQKKIEKYYPIQPESPDYIIVDEEVKGNWNKEKDLEKELKELQFKLNKEKEYNKMLEENFISLEKRLDTIETVQISLKKRLEDL